MSFERYVISYGGLLWEFLRQAFGFTGAFACSICFYNFPLPEPAIVNLTDKIEKGNGLSCGLVEYLLKGLLCLLLSFSSSVRMSFGRKREASRSKLCLRVVTAGWVTDGQPAVHPKPISWVFFFKFCHQKQ